MASNPTRVNMAFGCAMRTSSTIITAKGRDLPQPVPATPMPGRRMLIIQNADNGSGGDDPGNTRVVIAGPDVYFDRLSGNANLKGYVLEKWETITICVGDDVPVFAVQDNRTEGNLGSADLRAVEIA